MDDQMEISSTTPSYRSHDEDRAEHVNSQTDEALDFLGREAEAHVAEDDILDLAGGAKDAIERHRSTLPRDEEPRLDLKQDPEPSSTFDLPEPEAVKPAPIGGATKPTKAEEKEEKTTVAPAKTKSSLVDLMYWRDVQRTGVVFGASLLLLLSLSACSVISVASYVALALLSVTISFRIYKGILQAVQKSEDGHPFKMYLDKDIAIPTEMIHKYSDMGLMHVNTVIKELRRLFLVEDLVDSLKAQIDHYYGLVNKQIKDIVAKIRRLHRRSNTRNGKRS
ncbi:Reticulon-4 Neurite outgrowth inhibitor [Triplophysa tibetana]|uniref:Reticulon n=1 Tax=Triplophysa tibetana TaxID=1572043 RepID=A0A5A9NY87_9TELE|nr:Reticulon-4 Neurite outgrowth inhibitor [Triplophysa tibetana]